MNLTPREIKIFDEYAADRIAAKEAFTVAITYYTNRIAELHKIKQEAWKEALEVRNLDTSKAWETAFIDGVSIIREGITPPKDK